MSAITRTGGKREALTADDAITVLLKNRNGGRRAARDVDLALQLAVAASRLTSADDGAEPPGHRGERAWAAAHVSNRRVALLLRPCATT